MTPTPEMIALAERIAGHRRDAWWSVAYEAALTAIMEVSEKAADYLKRYHPYTSEEIRNGDHLR